MNSTCACATFLCCAKHRKKNIGILCNFLLKIIIFILHPVFLQYVQCFALGFCCVFFFTCAFIRYLSSFCHPVVCSFKLQTTIDSSVKNMKRLRYGMLLFSRYIFFCSYCVDICKQKNKMKYFVIRTRAPHLGICLQA